MNLSPCSIENLIWLVNTYANIFVCFMFSCVCVVFVVSIVLVFLFRHLFQFSENLDFFYMWIRIVILAKLVVKLFSIFYIIKIAQDMWRISIFGSKPSILVQQIIKTPVGLSRSRMWHEDYQIMSWTEFTVNLVKSTFSNRILEFPLTNKNF